MQTLGTVAPSRPTLMKTHAIAAFVVVGLIVMSAAGLAFAWRRQLLGPLELGLFAEPTDLDIVNTHRGCIEIACRATGKATHAAMSHLGVDASELYLCLAALREGLQRDFPGTNFNVGHFEAGHPDAINVVPDRAAAVIDVRPSAELQERGASHIAERLHALAAQRDLKLEHEITIDMSPLRTEPAELATLEQAVRDSGLEPTYADLLGTSEAGMVNHRFGFPCVNFGPGPMAMAHRVDEYVDLGMLARCKDVLERLVRAYDEPSSGDG